MDSDSDRLDAYLDGYWIRKIELEIARRYHLDGESPMKCPTHLSVGAEHLAVAVARTMPPGTKAYSTHRSHSHYLAWGGDLRRMLAELHGKKTGCAGGWGGSMHLVDESVGFMGASAIVGSSLSYAVGSALAAKLEGSDRWTVAFVGDAVPETGQFWEAMNFSLLKKLNLLVVIEDNDLATATPKYQRQNTAMLDQLAPVIQEGVSYADLVHIVNHILVHADEEEGIHIMRVPVERYFEHVGPGVDDWRDAPELWGKDDPVRMMGAGLLEPKRTGMQAKIDALKPLSDIDVQIDAVFEQAASDPWPDPLPPLFYGGRMEGNKLKVQFPENEGF